MIIIRKGEVIDYQTMIEEIIGTWLSEQPFYDSNWECKKEFKGSDTDSNGWPIDKDRAYFVADADYEIKLIKKRTNHGNSNNVHQSVPR